MPPSKTLYISGTEGAVVIGDYGTNPAAISNPYPYVNNLNFHSSLPYIQIRSKIIVNTAITFPALPRGTISWEDPGSGSKGGVCFSPDTLILMYDNSTKPIKNVIVGDLVWNKDRSAFNKVTFIEKGDASDYKYLYSPDLSIKPFATLNHPLFINGKYVSPLPEQYIWLNTEYIDPATIIETHKVCDAVYNLWTTGDHTYIANGFGTHSIVDNGGAILHGYNYGILTHQQCSEIIIDVSADTPEHLYGSYLINKFIGKFKYKPIIKLLAYFAVAPRITVRRQLFKILSGITGNIAKIVRKL